MKILDFKAMILKHQRGAAVVEAAIITLSFFVLIFGLFECGRFFNIQQILTNAAREGARFAVAPQSGTDNLPTNGEIQSVIQGFLDSGNVTNTSIEIERPVLIATGEIQSEFTRIRVTASYQVLSLSMFSFLNVTSTSNSLMRNETSP